MLSVSLAAVCHRSWKRMSGNPACSRKRLKYLMTENGYVESFNGRMRDELLKREIFHALPEAQILTEHWRKEYHCHRPHSCFGSRPPVPPAWLLAPVAQQD